MPSEVDRWGVESSAALPAFQSDVSKASRAAETGVTIVMATHRGDVGRRRVVIYTQRDQMGNNQQSTISNLISDDDECSVQYQVGRRQTCDSSVYISSVDAMG